MDTLNYLDIKIENCIENHQSNEPKLIFLLKIAEMHTTIVKSFTSHNIFLQIDRLKKFMQSTLKPYLIAFKQSTTSHFGSFHTGRENSIFVKIIYDRSHFSSRRFYTKHAQYRLSAQTKYF